MKGIVKLVAIKTPVEGIKVVYSNSVEEIKRVDKVANPTSVYLEDFDDEDWVYLSELQQIAIESEPMLVDFKTCDRGSRVVEGSEKFKSITYPLSPDDYEKALPLIGQEVEFGISNSRYGEDFRKERGDYLCAKLITSSPIVYSEEECIKAVKTVLSHWKTACINIRGEVNVEFLAEIEMTLHSYKKK